MTLTSIDIDDNIYTIIDNKRESKKKIINKALKLYLNEFDSLDTEIKEMEYKISKMKGTLNKYKKFQEELKKEKVEKKQELKNRDILKELINKLGWSDVYDENRCVEKLQDLSDSTLRIHADELGVDVNKLVKEINKYIENGGD